MSMSAPPPSVIVMSPAGVRGAPVPLSPTGLTLGREPDNTLHLDDPMVSRYHLRIDWNATSQQATVTDLGSSNGTILGETRLAPHDPRPWPAGTWLRVGAWFIQLELPVAASSAGPPRASNPDWTTPALPVAPAGGPPPVTQNPAPVSGTPSPANVPAGSGGRI